jgi:hypothetical protein
LHARRRGFRPHSLAEFIAFLRFLEADPEAFAAASELWARYERWRRQ